MRSRTATKQTMSKEELESLRDELESVKNELGKARGTAEEAHHAATLAA